MSYKLKKILNNKIFLFIMPNLISAFILLYVYNANVYFIGEVLFYEVWLLFAILLGINSIVYCLLKKIMKNDQKVAYVLFFLTWFYFVKFNIITFLLFVCILLLFVIFLKKFVYCKLDNCIGIISFIAFSLFGYNFLLSIYNVTYFIFSSKEYDYHFEVEVENTVTPNIYWIHCDGMLGLDIMKKYLSYDNQELEKYFFDNQYVVNEDARLIAGHSTQRALVAMFNPYYYDNFFKSYLMDLESSYINNNSRTSFVVDYYELQDKRLNNELFKSLKEKNYSTIAVADFNQYTSLNTDYFYDYFVFDSKKHHIAEKQELRYISKNNTDSKLLSYIQFNHFRTLLNQTFLYQVLKDINYLNYQVLDYDNFNFEDYPYIEQSDYWISKAIIKSISHSLDIEGPKFVFVDYKLNHLPITFDFEGNILDEKYSYNLDFYLDNYLYSAKLLIEMLDFIHVSDKEGIIIVQGDHGIHMLSKEYLMNYFSMTDDEVQEIRNSVISAYYIPEQYKSGEEVYLDNPLNISRYIVNNYIGKNYQYVD